MVAAITWPEFDHDAALLGKVAKGIFERSDAATLGRLSKLHRHYTSA
jgi:hypothetical protein